MNEPPQDVRSLATLSPDERSRALERYRILQPCTEDGVPLTHVARYQATPLRTLQLWLAQYRRHGLAGLARRPRRDRGQPQGLQRAELRFADPTELWVARRGSPGQGPHVRTADAVAAE